MIDQPGHILVVDDHEINRLKISFAVKKLGHTVEMAEDGRQALEILRAQPFDLVLLDIVMPEMDGYQVLEHMKADNDLRDIPVIVISAEQKLSSVVKGIELGAEGYLPKTFASVLLKAQVNTYLEKKRFRDQEREYMRRVQQEKQRSDDLLHVVIPLGVALTAEQDFNQLLEKILLGAMAFCHADAGTMYLRTKDDRLEFVIVRNNSLNIIMGGTSDQPITFSPLFLYDKTSGQPNHHNVVTRATLTGALINIPDVYQIEEFDFSGTKAFDAETGYCSTSFLTIPLKNSFSHVIGVLQLINAQDPETGRVIPFDRNKQEMIVSLSLLATVALESYVREQGLRQEIQQLRIELDKAKQTRQVNQITGTDYFKQLRSKAGDLRDMLVEDNE